MNDCSCVYSGGDNDYTEAYVAHNRKARKDHRCYECGELIKRGEIYEEVTGIWDGRPDRFRTCRACLSVREALFCKSWCHGGIWEDLYNHIDYCAGKIDLNKLVGIEPNAREKVCDMIERAWERYSEYWDSLTPDSGRGSG